MRFFFLSLVRMILRAFCKEYCSNVANFNVITLNVKICTLRVND